MADREQVYSRIREVASRAMGEAARKSSNRPIPDWEPTKVDYLHEIAVRADVGRSPRKTPVGLMKRAAMRLTRPFIQRQVHFNHSVRSALEAVALDRDHRLSSAMAGITSLELAVDEIDNRLVRIEAALEELRGTIRTDMTEPDEDRVRKA